MKRFYFSIIMLAFFSVATYAADLPSEGLISAAPEILAGPGAPPPDPGAPLGGGVFILLGLSITYIINKKLRR